jgi:pimeloyl-ACP methyl ester carboxylesterase
VLRVRNGGTGPPVLLLHGHPRTHATWHRVAPLLTRTHTVVCPDPRGYGESSKVPTTTDHAPYSKRAMAGSHRGRSPGALQEQARRLRDPQEGLLPRPVPPHSERVWRPPRARCGPGATVVL